MAAVFPWARKSRFRIMIVDTTLAVSGLPRPVCAPPVETKPERRRTHPRRVPVVHDRLVHLEGIDAPICQDSRSGSQVCGLARSVVCHHALKDLAGEKAFETADDLPFGPPFSGASFDVVEGW